MKDNMFYAVLVFGCGLLFFGSITTNFAEHAPVHEMWTSDLAVGNTTTFNVHFTGPAEQQIFAVLVDGTILSSNKISVPSVQNVSIPLQAGKYVISVELFDEQKSYDDFGSKAKPYYLFFRVEVK